MTKEQERSVFPVVSGSRFAHNDGVFEFFANPWILLGLPAAALAAWRWPRLPTPVLRLPTTAQCAGLFRRITFIERTLRWLLASVGTLLIAAAAGPRWGLGSPSVAEGISLALVVDVSASMATTDFVAEGRTLSRLAGVQDVFRLLVAGGHSNGHDFPGRPHDLIALISFATRPETACPPTLDHDALLTILDGLKPKTLVTEATTNPGDAIAWAVDSLQRSPTRRKAMILLTDGESNVPYPALTPRQAGHLAAKFQIQIYTIDALSDDETGPDAAKAHQTLVDLAVMTGGRSFRARDAVSLRTALGEIDRLERDAIVADAAPQYLDLSLPLSMAAFVTWLSYLTLAAPTRRGAP